MINVTCAKTNTTRTMPEEVPFMMKLISPGIKASLDYSQLYALFILIAYQGFYTYEG